MIRLATLSFCWDISSLFALPLGAWLFNSGGYSCVLGTSLVLFIFACILGLARLWGFKEKINTTDISLKGLFSLILV